MSKRVACWGDVIEHAPGTPTGAIVLPGQLTVLAGGIPIAVGGATCVCSVTGHMAVPNLVIPNTVRSFAGGKLIIAEGALTTCGATVKCMDRKVTVE